jgi:hypothetical protein
MAGKKRDVKVVSQGIDPIFPPYGRIVVFTRSLKVGHHFFAMDAAGSNVCQLNQEGNGFRRL